MEVGGIVGVGVAGVSGEQARAGRVAARKRVVRISCVMGLLWDGWRGGLRLSRIGGRWG